LLKQETFLVLNISENSNAATADVYLEQMIPNILILECNTADLTTNATALLVAKLYIVKVNFQHEESIKLHQICTKLFEASNLSFEA
jgi:hypothetical protein